MVRELVAAAIVGLPFGIGATTAADGPAPLFRFSDPAIVESSGLVAAGGVVVTVNDSGDEARVFSVDPATGATVGVSRWPGEPVDVEALAPAGPGEVWVADIGDNTEARDSVRVTRVPVGRGEQSTTEPGHELVYPGGAVDAEALLADPDDGRLFVVTKGLFGSRVYAAPSDLAAPGPHRLRPVGRVMPLVTDGAFFPDGRHLVLRDYTHAAVLTFPDLDVLGEVPLPATRQGEGIAVTADDRLLVSSEGLRAPVHEVPLPPRVAAAMSPGSTDPSTTAAPSQDDGRTARGGAAATVGEEQRRDAWPWLLGGLAGVAVVAVLVRSLRPH